MAEKYFFRYYDNENTIFRCGISSDNFVGSTTEIQGRCYVDYPETDLLEPIKGSGLRMDLEATTAQDFTDLFSDDEREWRVTLLRDSSIIFEGFLNPEGLYQDFTSDKWDIQLDVVDGLGFLENLAYVDSSGNPYSGTQNILDIVVKCLERVGIELNIRVAIDIIYTGLSESDRMENKVFYKADRFYRDDDDTIMDCKEVISSVLKPFGAVICQNLGKWIIFRPSYIATEASPQFNEYNSSGVLQGGDSVTHAQIIGSDISGATIIHANKNQKLSLKSTLSAFRVNYKYGLDDSIFVNPSLVWDSSSVIAGWTELVPPSVSAYELNGGVYRHVQLLAASSPIDIFQTDDIQVTSGDILSFSGDVLFKKFVNKIELKISLEDDGSADVYRLDDDGFWVLSGTNTIDWSPGGSNDDIEVSFLTQAAEGVPVTGKIVVTFLNPLIFGGGPFYGILKSFKVFPSTDNNIKGEFHTVERSTAPSTKVDDVIEVSNGDNDTNIYFGSIYKVDETTRTTTWKRKGVTETLPLLQIMAEDRLRQKGGISQVFSGDIYGYIPYLSLITINSLIGDFMINSYSYDTKANIITLSLEEILSNELIDIDYTFTLDYGKTVKPTIRG